ncbi:hypothetical protein [Brevundimonas olei]|uniref:hypothetical protein n=1 Tax=Brevundimonas olei TaxID=657642 RepID=UPI0031CFDAA7
MMGVYSLTADRCRQMLEAGVDRETIAKTLNCSRANVAYHAGQLGLTNRRKTTRWDEIQADLDNGLSKTEVAKKHKMSRNAIYQAITRGSITARRTIMNVSDADAAGETLAEVLNDHGVEVSVELATDVVKDWSSR